VVYHLLRHFELGAVSQVFGYDGGARGVAVGNYRIAKRFLELRPFAAHIDKIIYWNNNGFVVIISQCTRFSTINYP
jgi:hypothetical protein